MRKSLAHRWLLATCLAAGTMAASANDVTWMSVLLGGRKIGHLMIERERADHTVTTTQALWIELERDGHPIPMGTRTRAVETDTGQPLAFFVRTTLSNMDSLVEGHRQPDGRYAVTRTVGGVAHHATLDWPAHALLAEGQRLALLAASGHPGRHYPLDMFDPINEMAVRVDMQEIGDEPVQLPGGAITLDHQRQSLATPRGSQVMDLWLDHAGQTRKGTLNLLGQPLEMLACDRACAMAPVQHVDMFRAALVASPHAIAPAMRHTPLRYRLHVPEGDPPPAIATDEQRITPLGHGDWQVDIGPPKAGNETPPTPDDTRPNDWLQADAPAIRRLATDTLGNAHGDAVKMDRLRRFVSGYLTPHGLDVGYASALEVLRDRRGDCTEYAVLLAAMARAAQIPARVVTGMVYSGRGMVFLPHAWVQAWVDGHWQSFDAALGQADSTHIALDTGDGDPWHFFNSTELFRRLRIEQVEPMPSPERHL